MGNNILINDKKMGAMCGSNKGPKEPESGKQENQRVGGLSDDKKQDSPNKDQAQNANQAEQKQLQSVPQPVQKNEEDDKRQVELALEFLNNIPQGDQFKIFNKM